MVAVIVFGHFTNLRGLRVSGRSLIVLIAKRHRDRMQVLQRQADDQHQHGEFCQKMIHAAILIVQGRTWQAQGKTEV